MHKLLTKDNLVGFAVSIVAGLVAIAIYNRFLPASVKKFLG